MYIPDNLLEEIRSQNDIVDVISGYVRLQKKGNDYFGLCPFHSEKTPSFSVSRSKQMYYCFGCGAGGNVITFLMEYENYTFQEAAKFLADRVGIKIPEQEYSSLERERANLRSALLAINKLAAKYYYARLKSPGGETAMAYLKKRMLSDETIRAFGLGYADKSGGELYRFLKSKGYTDEMLSKAGLVTIDPKRGPYDKFWNRVMFPIMDANSRVIGFGGRVMGQGEPKYLNSPETEIFDKGRNLYGLHRARSSRKDYFILCEGYMDVIALHQAGFTNAVASLGTAFTSGHASLIRRYVKEVYMAFDSDEAGTRAALRAFPILREAGITSKVIRMDPYKDPDEFIKNLGEEAFKERIEKASNGFMFSLEVLERSYDMKSPEGRTGFLRAAALRLTEFDEEIERNNYIEAVAEKYRVRSDDLRTLVAKAAIKAGYATPAARPRQTGENKKQKEDGNITSQKILLSRLLDGRDTFLTIKEYISPEDFTTELYRKVADIIYAQYEEGELVPARVLNHFTDESEHREVAAIFNAGTGGLSQLGIPGQDMSGTPAAFQPGDQGKEPPGDSRQKALMEIIIRVKNHSIDEAMGKLEPADIEGMQRLMALKKSLQDLGRP